MAITQFEIHWQSGDRAYTLTLDEDGVPHIDTDVERPAPRPQKEGPPRRGKPWTEEEEDAVAIRVRTVEDATAVAQEMGRSRGAVLARAVKLGMFTLEEAGLRYPPGA